MSDVFDERRARTFRPNPDFVKTAVLVDVTDTDAITEIATSSGVQRVRGPFYIVADGTQSYGASRQQFEAAHVGVGPNQWAKSEPIRAYRADERCVITTWIDDHAEGTVQAEPGDWIVRQATGEVMVVTPDQFAARYLDAT